MNDTIPLREAGGELHTGGRRVGNKGHTALRVFAWWQIPGVWESDEGSCVEEEEKEKRAGVKKV